MFLFFSLFLISFTRWLADFFLSFFFLISRFLNLSKELTFGFLNSNFIFVLLPLICTLFFISIFYGDFVNISKWMFILVIFSQSSGLTYSLKNLASLHSAVFIQHFKLSFCLIYLLIFTGIYSLIQRLFLYALFFKFLIVENL